MQTRSIAREKACYDFLAIFVNITPSAITLFQQQELRVIHFSQTKRI
ncbi:hypothetical protein BREVNS_1983 [Brevinematales bacterium NS]|nr:hypothetical protein BREVNS_1983 [Brevinematales bacterium NS]